MNLMNFFGESSIAKGITVLDVIKDFAENNESINPIKGGMALNYLYNNKQPSARNTVDIDYHFEKEGDWNKFKTESIDKATKLSKLGIVYNIIKTKVNENGESLTVEFTHKDLCGKFKIDMNYGTYCKTVNVGDVILYSPEMIIADKLSVICSSNIQRRCKDLYDIYLVTKHESFKLHELAEEVFKKVQSRGIAMGKLSLLNPEILYNLQLGYRKLKLIDMPEFAEICKVDLKFVLPLLALLEGANIPDIEWNCANENWNTTAIYGLRVAKDLKGIIEKESASAVLHLSTFPPFPTLVSNKLVDVDMGIVKFSTKNYNEDNIRYLGNDLYVTNEARTIIDMLEDGEYRILIESIETYKDMHNGNLDSLFKIAKEYNKVELLKEVLKDIN